VIAVKVAEEQELDGAGVDAEPVHVGQQRRPAVEQDAPVDDDRAVVALAREGGAAAKERELQLLTGPAVRPP
jgi:hypothetical protein